jgi:uncharacterized protein YfcZ (UPF0381/DUF406 family)
MYQRHQIKIEIDKIIKKSKCLTVVKAGWFDIREWADEILANFKWAKAQTTSQTITITKEVVINKIIAKYDLEWSYAEIKKFGKRLEIIK